MFAAAAARGLNRAHGEPRRRAFRAADRAAHSGGSGAGLRAIGRGVGLGVGVGLATLGLSMFAGLTALGTALGGGVQAAGASMGGSVQAAGESVGKGVQAAGASVEHGLTKIAVGGVVGSAIDGFPGMMCGAAMGLLLRKVNFSDAPFWRRRGGAGTEQAAGGDTQGASCVRSRCATRARRRV